MKKNSIVFILITMLLCGCSNEQIKTNVQPPVSSDTPVPVISEEQKKNVSTEVQKANSIKDIPNDLEEYKTFIKKMLKPRMTKDQVIGLFGSKYTDITGTDPVNSDICLWRYDLLCKGEYSYPKGMDVVDVGGLALGNVKIVLIVKFSAGMDSIVLNYSIYYFDNAAKCVKINDFFSDGTVNEGRYAGEIPNIGKVQILPLSSVLADIYSKYAKTRNDELLRGLGVLDICRLYFNAEDKRDYETMYALYIHDKNYPVPTREEFLNAINKDTISPEINKKLLKSLKEDIKSVMLYDNIRSLPDFPEVYGYVQINFNKDTLRGKVWRFQLVQDSKNIWKVQFMPLQ